MAPKRKTTAKKTGKRGVFVWLLLGGLLLAAGVLGINVTSRARRVVQETNHVRSAVQEAVRRQQMLVKAPARKEFSPAFLQMAFGDNPPLLEQIKEALSQAIGEKPQLTQGDVAMMLVTYRAEGELHDVAIHVFGNLNPERLPAFSTEGYWKSQLPDQFYNMGQSALSLMGREVLILASKDVEKRQRELLDASTNDRFPVVQNYFHDPISFIAVIPEPAKLFTDHYRPHMAAVLIKGKISMDEARLEFVALSFDQRKAQELAQMLSDARTMAASIARIRYGGANIAESAYQALERSRVRAEGPTVVINSMMPGKVLEQAMPQLVRVLSKGVGRIRRGPGYPS
ncbi:MAG: hypothetical protein PCFJNLEI_01904 [Verrucomicrobiae bacterium]|nr:hypothetical protein [Verrucomicrobiae bacterium]